MYGLALCFLGATLLTVALALVTTAPVALAVSGVGSVAAGLLVDFEKLQ